MLNRLKELFARKPAPPAPAFDVMAYATEEDREGAPMTYYGFIPAEIYPATIRRIITVMASGELPVELVEPYSEIPNGVAQAYLLQAVGMGTPAFYAAMIPREECLPWQREARKAALNLARLWFTQALHVQQQGQKTGVHIYADPDYRL